MEPTARLTPDRPTLRRPAGAETGKIDMTYCSIRASAALAGALALLIDASASFAMTLPPPAVSSPISPAFQGGVHRPPGGVHRPPPGGYHRPPVAGRPPGYRPPVGAWGRPPGGVYRPGYYGGWRRPSYGWAPGGAIAAGAALGVLSAAAAAAYISSQPPGPGLCWYYTDPSRRSGFWDACGQ